MKNSLRTFVWSLFLTTCYLGVAFAALPFAAKTHDGKQSHVDMGRAYTAEELEQSDKKMGGLIEMVAPNNRQKSFVQVFSEARQSVILFSCFPWFIFPFFRKKPINWYALAGLLGVPFIGVATTLLTWLELVAIALALFAGGASKRMVSLVNQQQQTES